MLQNFPAVLNIGFSFSGIWLVAISLGIYSRNILGSSYKVGSDSFCLFFFDVSLEK